MTSPPSHRLSGPWARSRRWCALAVLIGVLSAPALAARPKLPAKKVANKPSWVVLVHSQGDVPSSWTLRLRSAAQGAQDRNWVDPPAVTLDEVQLVLGCASWGISCAAQVAAMTGASNALVIEVTRAGADATVVTQAVSADGLLAQDDRVDVSVNEAGLLLAEAWVAGAVKGARPNVLIVTADLEGTDVVIDNLPRGKTPLTLIDLVSVGEHALLLRREGRAPLSRSISVATGIHREHGVLSSGGPAMKSSPVVGTAPLRPASSTATTTTTTTPPADLPATALVGWSLTGVGAATALIAGVVGAVWQLDVADYNANIVDGKINVDYRRTLGAPISGPERGAFFTATFGSDGADPVQLAEGVSAKQGAATVCFLVTAIGALVAVTGVTLAQGSDEAADALAAP